MSNAGPSIATINLPGLASALLDAGFDVSEGTSENVKAVESAINDARQAGRPCVVVAGVDIPTLDRWVRLKAVSGTPILVARSDHFVEGAAIPKTREIQLPATVDEIMAKFGAPALSRGGDRLITSTGELEGQGVESEVGADDAFNVFSTPPRHHEDTTDNSHASDLLEGETAPLPTPQVFAPREEPPRVFPERRSVASLDDEVSEGPEHRAPLRNRPAQSSESILAAPRATPKSERRAQVIVVFAGKGGVGKSTTAVSLGERAATLIDGLRVVVVDANRGQGDLRTFLRLSDAPLPSVYDVAISRSDDALDDAIINPKRLAAHRAGRSPIHFGLVLAPSRDQSDPYIVNASIYAKVIEHARAKADLVIIDTQIVESFDTSGVIDDVVVPLLIDGAWGLGISDASTAGAENLISVLSNFVKRGVSTNRLMVCLNSVTTSSAIDTDAMSSFVEKYATWMGVAPNDPAIASALNRGEILETRTPLRIDPYTLLLDKVLHRTTGAAAFAPHADTSRQPTIKKSGRHGLRFKRPRGKS